MDISDDERFKAINKLIDDYGYPLPLYCDNCKKRVGFYFKTGLGRWDGKPSKFYCIECGKKMQDSKQSRCESIVIQLLFPLSKSYC